MEGRDFMGVFYFGEAMVAVFTSYKGIQIKGLPSFEKEMNKLLKAVSGKKQEIVDRATIKVADAIEKKTPKGPTGREKKSVYHKVIPETLDHPVIGFAGYRPKIAPHAFLEEYGHAGPHPAPPHPTVRPVWDSIRQEITNDIAHELGKTIDGAI